MDRGKQYDEELSSIVRLLFEPVQAVLDAVTAEEADRLELIYAAKSLFSSARDQLDQIAEHIGKEVGEINVICDRFDGSTPSYNKILGVEILKGIPPGASTDQFMIIKDRIGCLSPRLRELMAEAEREISRDLGRIRKIRDFRTIAPGSEEERQLQRVFEAIQADDASPLKADDEFASPKVFNMLCNHPDRMAILKGLLDVFEPRATASGKQAPNDAEEAAESEKEANHGKDDPA